MIAGVNQCGNVDHECACHHVSMLGCFILPSLLVGPKTISLCLFKLRYNALGAMEIAGMQIGVDLGPAAWGIRHLQTFDSRSSLAAKQQLDDEREQLMTIRMARLRTVTVDALTVTSTRAAL